MFFDIVLLLFQEVHPKIQNLYMIKQLTEKPTYEELKKRVQKLEQAESRRKRAEELLIDSKKRLHNIIEDIPALILRFESKGIISFVNKEYCAFFAKSEQDLLGTNFLELIPEEEKQSVWERFLVLTPDNPANTHEYPIISGDGFISWHHWMNRAIFNKDGEVSVYQSIGYDITEQMQIEKEVREKEKLQGVIELAGTVCHELSQPMQIISGISDLVLMNISKNDDLHKKLSKIKEQVERMAELTMKLRDITRYETKTYSGETKIIDLDQSADRRNAKRHLPVKLTIVVLKLDPPIKTQLIDIGTIGISFWCDKDKIPKHTVFKIDLHILDEGYTFNNIPCMFVSDPESSDDETPRFAKMDRCSVKFDKLNPE